MLVNKLYEPGDILCFKVTNGDEIIAKFVEGTTDGYVITRPCTVIPSPQGIGLVQSLFCGELNNNVTLKFDHVIMHAPVVKEMEAHYIKTTTGIQTVNKGGLIT